MQFPTEHPSNRDELTPPLQAELERIDALLAEALRRPATPRGLVERVLAASAALAPRPALAGPWRIDVLSARSRRAAMWGRLALAASVALAFLIARPLLSDSNSTPLSGSAILVMSRAGADDLTPALRVLESARDEAAYFESLGIFDVRTGDLLNDLAAMTQTESTRR
jgi:hypothetical protein